MSKKIVIDPGHGGKDAGAIGYGLQEKDLALDIALRTRSSLTSYQTEVYLTRDSDLDMELSERADFANSLQADYFLSIHINAGGGTGFESYVYIYASENSRAFQELLHSQVSDYYRAVGFVDRGKKNANFAVLRLTSMPAALLENLFIDRVSDATKLADPTFRQGIADAITAGLVEVLGLQEVQVDSVAEAIKVFQAAGIIDSPDYWLENARPGKQVAGEYVGLLIQKAAKALK